MPYLIIPSRKTRCPSSAKKPDRAVINETICSSGNGAWGQYKNNIWTALGVGAHARSYGPEGVCWVPTTSGAVGVSTGIAASAMRSVLLMFEVRVAALTSASTAFVIFGSTATASSNGNIPGGAATGYIGGETVSINGASGRSGIGDSLSIGAHTLVIHWNAATSRYEFWLDGSLRPLLTSTDDINAIETVTPAYFGGRNNSGAAHVCPIVFAWGNSERSDFRPYAARPWSLFAPDPHRLYFDGGASGGGGDTSLIFSDSTQTQTTDAAVLVTSSFLVVQEATQSHSSENVVLDASVSTNLIVADATQVQTSENSTLQVSTNLGIDDSIQSQTSDNIALTSVHSLIIQECIQDQTSENIALDSGLILTVADCIQGQTAENITILASSLLLINDATQDQTAENLSFTLATNISVNDSVHSISSESPNLTIPGSGTGATVEEIVDGIMTALLAETIPVNIKKINDVLVYGIGTDGNPWRESA